jgi:hypothetical protein
MYQGAKDTIANEVCTFTTMFSLGKTRLKARFLRDNDGRYACICGGTVSDKESADAHLAALSGEQIRETHSQGKWKQRLKMRVQ